MEESAYNFDGQNISNDEEYKGGQVTKICTDDLNKKPHIFMDDKIDENPSKFSEGKAEEDAGDKEQNSLDSFFKVENDCADYSQFELFDENDKVEDDVVIKMKYNSSKRKVAAETVYESFVAKSNLEVVDYTKELLKPCNWTSKVDVDIPPAYRRDEVCSSSVFNEAISVKKNTTQANNIKMQTARMGRSKSKQCKKQQIKPSFELITFNRFEALKDESDHEIYTIEDSKEEQSVELKSIKRLSAKKILSVYNEKRIEIPPCTIEVDDVQVKKFNVSLIHLANENRFHVLTDNPEEDVLRILKRRQLIGVSRHCLKKCNRCCFKKRNCLVDPLTCKALQSCCFTCGKQGHFPQSLRCKARKRVLKRKIDIETKNIKQTTLNEDIVLLLKKQIDQIERKEEEQKSESFNLENQEVNDQQKFRKMKCLTSAKYLLKAAEYFERKFSNTNQEKRTENFIRYCRKQFFKSKKLWKNFSAQLSELIKQILENDKTKQKEELFNHEIKDNEQQFEHESQFTDIFTGEIQQFDWRKDLDVDEDDQGVVGEHIPAKYNEIESMKAEVVHNSCRKNLFFKYTTEDDAQFHQDLFAKNYQLRNKVPLLGGFPGIKLEKSEKTIYAIYCENKEIKELFNFLRSFNLLWLLSENHHMCNIEKSCFFCTTRSSFLRLRRRREKGLKCIKLNEYVSQLYQYDDNLGWKWKENSEYISLFIKKTFTLLIEAEPSISSKILLPLLPNQSEGDLNEAVNEIIFHVEIDVDEAANKVFTMKDLIQMALCGQKCLLEEDKCLIIQMSNPCTVNLTESEILMNAGR